MSIDAAVAWAKKMADVLGEKISLSDKEVATKSPRSGATPKSGGGSATNGAPSKNGAPSANGTPSAGPNAGGTPGPTASPTATGGQPPADAPAAPQSSSTPTGGSAKSCAEAAQKALAEVNSLVTKAQDAKAEALKAATDAEAAKKQIDDAKTQAEEADKGIGEPVALPTPQGEDASAQYDSAIQITGEMQKALSEAEAKEDTVRSQVGVAAEGVAQLEVAEKSAKKSAEQADRFSTQAGNAASDARSSAGAAETAAAASKAKADQAKDDAPDKAALQKAAQGDAQYAAAAKDAAGKAEAAYKGALDAASAAQTQRETVEKTKQEAKTIADGVKQLESGLMNKLSGFFARVGDAEAQEAEYKAKLSAEDAEAILRKRYEELGGDPELSQALADEDKDFAAITELHRAELKKWQNEKVRELDQHKSKLEAMLKDGKAFITPARKWLEREISNSTPLASEINALGDKLQTEPGKALLHEFSKNMELIEETQSYTNFVEKVMEKTKSSLEALTQRYQDVEAQYEASEKLISESRTELDNLLQMDEMSLEQKVDYLQTRPKPVRDRIKKSLDAELDRVHKLTILEAAAEEVNTDFSPEPIEDKPFDWEPLKAKISKIRETSLEELKQDDPKLADAKAEYERAGGDAALLEKRVSNWKSDMADREKRIKAWSDEYQVRTAQLNQQFQEAGMRLQDSEANANGFRSVLAQKRQQLQIFKQKAASKDATSQDKATVKLLENEIKRAETNLKNYQNEVAVNKAAKANAEKMIELERQRHEQVVDDDFPASPKPTADDVSRTPFPVKYTELTGNSVPVN